MVAPSTLSGVQEELIHNKGDKRDVEQSNHWRVCPAIGDNQEIFRNPKFKIDNAECFDVIPGKLGDKWLVSCMSMLYLSKEHFDKVVLPHQTIGLHYTGVYRFKIYWCGEWVEVIVDDRLPTVNGRLAFLQTTHTEQLWPSLLEKAYAKLHGSYEALKYGCFLDGLADFTGGVPESIIISPAMNTTVLYELLRTTTMVTAHYLPPPHIANEQSLEVGMNYRLTAIDKVNTINGPVFLVQLRKPMYPGEIPLPHIILNEIEWNTLSLQDRERICTNNNGFWMLFSDFLRIFSRMDMIHLEGTSSFIHKQQWLMLQQKGSWRKGINAGGCKNFNQFFHLNPQIQLTLREPDTVIISLNQLKIMEPMVIGFSIYKMPKHITEPALPVQFNRMLNVIHSHYTNSRHVTHRCLLQAGPHLIIPTTYEPREEGDFVLNVYSTKLIKIDVLDYAPKILRSAIIKAPAGANPQSFLQYEAMFLQLSDEHRTINAFELQELLEACLPNDYIKSCASTDTCKQIVRRFERNNAGRITLSDFKDLMCSLKHWLLIFKNHTIEKMGVLRAERLRDALRDVGFIIPERVHVILVQRFMRKDGTLRFGDFVSSVLQLQGAFGIFYANRIVTEDETVNMELTEVRIVPMIHKAPRMPQFKYYY